MNENDGILNLGEMLKNLPGLIGAKNKNSEIVGLTPELTRLVGWEKFEDSLGKSDYDIPCKASEFADKFKSLDKKVLGSIDRILTLDMQHYCEGWTLLLVEKNTIKSSNGEISGVFFNMMDVSKTGLFKYYMDLTTGTNKFHEKTLQPSSYIFTQTSKPFNLTRQQENCLFLLIRGKTAKEIAQFLRISSRTVEAHIVSIKNSLNCQSKSELVEESIHQGFSYYVPQDFLPENFKSSPLTSI